MEKDILGTVSKGAPDFCTVYVISKGKISSMRSASHPTPPISPLQNHILNQANIKPNLFETNLAPANSTTGAERRPMGPSYNMQDDMESIKLPFTRGKGLNGKSYGDLSVPDTNISFVSSGRANIDRIFPPFYDNNELGRTPRLSNSSDIDYHGSESPHFRCKSMDRLSWSSQTMDDVEAEMRRLKLELKQTMDMYSTACKEALMANQKAKELQRWKMEEERRLEEARLAEVAALAIAEKEKAKSRAAIEAAEAAQRIAELEAQKRINAEMKALKESEERKKVLDALAHSGVRYRKYSIGEIEAATDFFSESHKIGEDSSLLQSSLFFPSFSFNFFSLFLLKQCV
ncbi:hypothetical protein L1049_002913 [Liquidambar formosana]|uniref:RING-type E3 ubiquitin transferase n=1 Tax=Liquidambar formosana TaxID=63359 RepID=A0AAP0NJ10_LIQFO